MLPCTATYDLSQASATPLWCVQITCEGVDYTSSTFDPFLDLSLEINKASSLTRALQHFTAAEVLDGDNRYRCPKNNQLVGVPRAQLGMK